MNEPHVSRLTYRLLVDKGREYRDPAPVDWGMPGVFRARLENGFLGVELMEHHATIESARERIKPYLRAWEINAELRTAARIQFEYESAELVDLAPPPTGTGKLTDVKSTDHLLVGDNSAVVRLTVDVTVVSPDYPSPPSRFKASPLVETLWLHYDLYQQGRERLTDMGYVCYTAIKTDANGEKQAALRFGVSRDVLSRLKTLCSEVGDHESVRKITAKTQFRPHTDQERVWIEHVIRVLIRRAGECAAEPGATRPEISLASLPKLNRQL